jgi:hypothetical protein
MSNDAPHDADRSEVSVEVVRVPAGDGEPVRGYRLLVDGADVGELDVIEQDGVRDLVHTGVRPAFEGRGLAARLVRRAFDDARADGVRIRPSCPYVARWAARHPEVADLLV